VYGDEKLNVKYQAYMKIGDFYYTVNIGSKEIGILQRASH
jgi:hypothetical protein